MPSPSLFPMGALQLAPGQTASVTLQPQRPMRVCGVVLGALAASLQVRALQVGQESVLCSHEPVPGDLLEQLGAFRAPACGPGVLIRLELQNVGPSALEVRPMLLADVIDEPMRRRIDREHFYADPFDVMGDTDFSRPPRRTYVNGVGGGSAAPNVLGGCGGTDGSFASTHGAGGGCTGGAGSPTPGYPPLRFRSEVEALQRRLRHCNFPIAIDGVYGPATHQALISLLDKLEQQVRARDLELQRRPPESKERGLIYEPEPPPPAPKYFKRAEPGSSQIVPVPVCSSRRPDTGEHCKLPEGHGCEHHDGLAHSWPQQATPTRRELQERERYLAAPDEWNAWESPTDES